MRSWRGAGVFAFGLSALLVIIGLVLRLYVAETPLFEQTREAATVETKRTPLGEAIRGHWRQILLAAFTRFGENAGFLHLFAVRHHLRHADARSRAQDGTERSNGRDARRTRG